MPHKARFRPIQLKDGSAWYVLYTPDKGPTEHIEGFYTEEDALEWIELESASWLAKKKETRHLKVGGASAPPQPRAPTTASNYRRACGCRRWCSETRCGDCNASTAIEIASRRRGYPTPTDTCAAGSASCKCARMDETQD